MHIPWDVPGSFRHLNKVLSRTDEQIKILAFHARSGDKKIKVSVKEYVKWCEVIR